ncbi:MAG TPA: ISLre2 family transposase [Firmicutes bacterium]|jgi:ribosomal 50S subunit-associated protein YjgA (DUF615 family)|nr:ISLre2 family transposase [Bacillota bacterium]
MYGLSLNNTDLDFKTLEKTIYKTVCDIACNCLKDVLERLDLMLSARRDPKEYKNKGLKKTSIHTVMGTVEYSRRIYKTQDENGRNQYIFLLDKYLKSETIGRVSSNLAEKIVERALEEPYRKTAQAIESLSNKGLSHTAVWNVVQVVGEKLDAQERQLIREYQQGKSKGQRCVKVLFHEADGIWLSMQGKDRPCKGKSKKKELKLAVNYEGWKKRAGQKEGYVVHNKTVCSGFSSSREFKELWDATVAENYNTDEIEVRIINGDGASWIKAGLGEEGSHFQLDPFHISQAIIKKVPHKKQASKLKRFLRQGEVDKGFDYLTELLIQNNKDQDKFKKLEDLYNYLARNHEGLIPFHLRGIDLPKPPQGLEYRTLGTMEHNVCDIVALRMKGRKMSWSINGASHLAKLLAARASGTLYANLDGLLGGAVSEEKLEEVIEVVLLSAAEVNKKPKESKFYKIQESPVPFTGKALTEGRKAIQRLVGNRIASELVYR